MPAVEPPPAAAPASIGRLPAIDWLRGLVMLLMTVDHASGAFNAGRLLTDSVYMYQPGTALEPAQFLTRWITHLCAPTFVFLAGLSVALSAAKRRRSGEPDRVLDRYLVTRGLFIAACDPIWMSLAFVPGQVLFQVLYAIGLGFVCLAALRRVPARWLAIGALAFLAGHEALVGLTLLLTGGATPLPVALLLTGGRFGSFIVAYPLLPWLAIMTLGFACGEAVQRLDAATLARRCALIGAASLAIFAAARSANGYGNLLLYRDDHSLVQWLHVSKYPPSLTFTALELGLMALLLAGFLVLQRRGARLTPLLVLGQTAFFFYLLHAHLLQGAAHALGVADQLGLGATWLAAAVCAAMLWPVCARYRRYKAAHPDGWARYV